MPHTPDVIVVHQERELCRLSTSAVPGVGEVIQPNMLSRFIVQRREWVVSGYTMFCQVHVVEETKGGAG